LEGGLLTSEFFLLLLEGSGGFSLGIEILLELAELLLVGQLASLLSLLALQVALGLLERGLSGKVELVKFRIVQSASLLGS